MDDAWARGGVRLLLPLAGSGWPIWETVSVDFLKIYICILLKIHGDYWQGAGMAKSVPSSTVTGLELRGQGPHSVI